MNAINVFTPKENKAFIGRSAELQQLKKLDQANEAAILTVYGRRRVGKTELLEQAFRQRNILKFEGIEGRPAQEQMNYVLQQLAIYIGETRLLTYKPLNWIDVLTKLAEYTREGIWTIYFEEVQWLACYKDTFIAELKYVWDNYFRFNEQLIVILCGSSPSFIINNIVKSKSLYNRSQYEIGLREFNLLEAQQLLAKRSQREVMDAYLCVGGVPEYLKRINSTASVIQELCENSFVQDSYFFTEYERLYTSSLHENKHYRDIIEFLSKHKHATRTEINKHLKLSSGGYLSSVLSELEQCNFIVKQTPYNLGSDSNLARYSINDNYLHFYYKFIKPNSKEISTGKYNVEPMRALGLESFTKWLGFAFERMIRKYDYIIAKILGFSGIDYRSGSFFNRATSKESPGYQLDLVFDRADNVYTICEIKYSKTTISSKVIRELEQKLELFPNPKQNTIQRVLITTCGADKQLQAAAYFDRVITFSDLFHAENWK